MGGFFHPLALLLRGEGYPAATTFALLLHGGLALFLIERNFTSTFVEVETVQYIQATTIAENPQAVASEQQKQVYEQQLARRRSEEQERQRQARERAAEEERQRQAEAEEQRRAEAQQRERAAEAERQRQAETEAQRRREEQAREEQAQREQAAREEAARQAAAQQQAAAQAESFASAQQSYMGIIQQTIQQYWSRPPSARNGMEVVLRIQLVPTGEVVDVDIDRSSGDFAFDRAAEQAVLKADRFPELQGMDSRLFEEKFRTIFLVFRPEDLLR